LMTSLNRLLWMKKVIGICEIRSVFRVSCSAFIKLVGEDLYFVDAVIRLLSLKSKL